MRHVSAKVLLESWMCGAPHRRTNPSLRGPRTSRRPSCVAHVVDAAGAASVDLTDGPQNPGGSIMMRMLMTLGCCIGGVSLCRVPACGGQVVGPHRLNFPRWNDPGRANSGVIDTGVL